MTRIQSISHKNLWTRLDSTGAIFGVTRLQGEDLLSFRERILNSFVHKMDSSYHGMLNSLLSELGLTRTRCISFALKTGVTSADFPRRAIVKTNNRLLICSRYNDLTDYTLDWSVELREKPYLSIYELVEDINSNSDIYTATLQSTSSTYGVGSENYWKLAKAFTLVNGINRVSVNETFTSTNIYTLEEGNILNGSLLFSDATALHSEVLTSAALANTPGNYYVDYTNGQIEAVSAIDRDTIIYYTYLDEPFNLFHSPVAISDIYSEEAQRFLFDEIGQILYTGDDDKTKPGHAKKEMVDIAYELLNVAQIYWGK